MTANLQIPHPNQKFCQRFSVLLSSLSSSNFFIGSIVSGLNFDHRVTTHYFYITVLITNKI